METIIIKMETQKVVFKMIGDEVIAIFPNNLYSEVLYGNTMVDSYMHIGQHSACSVELLDGLQDASEEQYKDLKIELEEIGYNLDMDIKTIEFMDNDTIHTFTFNVIHSDFWFCDNGYDIHYCEDDNEICVYKQDDTSKTIYSETIKN